MNLVHTDRGREEVHHPVYAHDIAYFKENLGPRLSRLVGQSPADGHLWVGHSFHLNRDEVAELVAYLNRWLADGSFIRPAG